MTRQAAAAFSPIRFLLLLLLLLLGSPSPSNSASAFFVVRADGRRPHQTQSSATILTRTTPTPETRCLRPSATSSAVFPSLWCWRRSPLGSVRINQHPVDRDGNNADRLGTSTAAAPNKPLRTASPVAAASASLASSAAAAALLVMAMFVPSASADASESTCTTATAGALAPPLVGVVPSRSVRIDIDAPVLARSLFANRRELLRWFQDAQSAVGPLADDVLTPSSGFLGVQPPTDVRGAARNFLSGTLPPVVVVSKHNDGKGQQKAGAPTVVPIGVRIESEGPGEVVLRVSSPVIPKLPLLPPPTFPPEDATATAFMARGIDAEAASGEKEGFWNREFDYDNGYGLSFGPYWGLSNRDVALIGSSAVIAGTYGSSYWYYTSEVGKEEEEAERKRSLREERRRKEMAVKGEEKEKERRRVQQKTKEKAAILAAASAVEAGPGATRSPGWMSDEPQSEESNGGEVGAMLPAPVATIESVAPPKKEVVLATQSKRTRILEWLGRRKN